jgi:hypothetical protein
MGKHMRNMRFAMWVTDLVLTVVDFFVNVGQRRRERRARRLRPPRRVEYRNREGEQVPREIADDITWED